MGDRARDHSESRGRGRGGDRRDDRDDRRNKDRDSSRSRDRRGRDGGRDGRDGGRDDRRRDNSRDRRERSRSRDRRDNGVSVLVRNLAFSVTSNDIRSIFSRYGEIRDVYVPLVSSLWFSSTPDRILLLTFVFFFLLTRIIIPNNLEALLSSNFKVAATLWMPWMLWIAMN